MEINSKNLVLNILGSESSIMINKKLWLKLGLEQVALLSFLIDQYKYFSYKESLSVFNGFYTSDMNLSMYTRMSLSKVRKIKKELIEKKLISIRIFGMPTKTEYIINFDKILEILSSDENQEDLAYINFSEELANKDEINLEELNMWRKNSLRLYCKKNRISYNGNDNKEVLINKILEFNNILQCSNNLSTSVQNSQCSKNMNTSAQKNWTLVSTKHEHIIHNNIIHTKHTNRVEGENQILSLENNVRDKKESEDFSVSNFEISNFLKEKSLNKNNKMIQAINNLIDNFEDNSLIISYLSKTYEKYIANKLHIKNKTAYFITVLENLDNEIYSELVKIKTQEIKKKQEIKKVEENKQQVTEKFKKVQESRENFNEILEKIKSLSADIFNKILFEVEIEYQNEYGEEALNNLLDIKNISTNKRLYYRMLTPFLEKKLANY